MSARGRVPQKGVSGRTHRSAPTRGGEAFGNQRGLAGNRGLVGRDGARPLQVTGAKRVPRGAPGVWPPPTKFRPGIWGVSHEHRPLRGRETEDGGGTPGSSCPTGGSSTTLGSRRIAERLRQRGRGTGRNRSRDHPQSAHQLRTIPQSRRSRASSLCTREPLRTGDADCRVASLLAMTALILCHSEEAQRADAPGA